MTDKYTKAIEGAARAIGYADDSIPILLLGWNPILNGDDALNLARQLRINIEFEKDWVTAICSEGFPTPVCVSEPYGEDKDLAVRVAITTLAAFIGPKLDD